jgi:hypothetical protein
MPEAVSASRETAGCFRLRMTSIFALRPFTINPLIFSFQFHNSLISSPQSLWDHKSRLSNCQNLHLRKSKIYRSQIEAISPKLLQGELVI